MGAFLSKLSEEHEAAKVQSAGNEDAKGASRRINGGDVVTVDPNSSGGNSAPLLPLLIGGVAYVMLSVALKYSSYVHAQMSLEKSAEKIEELEAMIQREGAQDPCLMVKLNKWKKRRATAEAYLKKHKLIGKLVRTFPPDVHID